ncbi:hypothetical protein ON010_g9635 [Phytophthora cinnamomi]|nr:hypothetical protein ON010_g9635 [Phytophthora cinnamomi]
MGRRRSVRHTSFSELTENFERLNVETDNEAADAAHRAAAARGMSAPIINPFGPSTPVPASPGGVSDVSMTDVSTPVLNAPNLPVAPVHRGSTFEERRTFMRQYEAYTIARSAFQTHSNRPFVMPVMACIDGDTRRRIAMFEFGCAPETITDEQWVQYFLEANVPVDRDNYLTIDEAMKSLRMNVKWKEAQSRMNQLQADMYKILEAYNLGDDMFRKAPRRIVGYLWEALQPAGFREIVRHQLTMESNKEMKKQIVPFCKWVTTMLAQYMQWNDDARAQKPASEARPGQRQQRGKPPHPSTTSSSTTTSSKPSSDQSTTGERKRPALPCLKCASPEHSVRHCPHAQPGEAEKLM